MGVAAYFLYFAIPAIRAGFAVDDPMNMGFYWIRGFWGDIADILRFWSTAYRPMGALFYLPIYHFAGLNPVPYRLLALALIGANIFLSWRVADLLTGSKAAAALTAILVTAHIAMGAIYFNTSMLYDIMAYFFLALMLCLYMSFRRRGEPISFWRGALVVGAFIAALDSKELAVVASGWVLGYELLFHRPWRLRLPILVCLMSIVYAIGKFLGPNALAKAPGYRLEPTLHRFFLNNRYYLDDLFTLRDYFVTSRRLVAVWIVLTAICWIARRRELWWCWLLVSTATLGISFTVEPRRGAGLYLALFAWALLVSTLATTFLRKRVAWEWAAVSIIALLWIPRTISYWRPQPAAYIESHQLTLSTIQQLEAMEKPKPNSRVIFLRNPFADYDVEFMGMLLWNDHSLQIDLANKLPNPPDLATYQWVLTFEGDRLRVLKRP